MYSVVFLMKRLLCVANVTTDQTYRVSTKYQVKHRSKLALLLHVLMINSGLVTTRHYIVF